MIELKKNVMEKFLFLLSGKRKGLPEACSRNRKACAWKFQRCTGNTANNYPASNKLAVVQRTFGRQKETTDRYTIFLQEKHQSNYSISYV